MSGFVKIRRGIVEHLLSGAIGFLEAGVYLTIHLQADYRTGVWTGSAPRLAATAPRGATLRDIQRALNRLAEIGFIRVFHTRGARGNYRVLIHKFEVETPALKGKRLNAFKSENWREPVYESCAEDGTEVPQTTRCGDAESEAEDAPYKEVRIKNEKKKTSCADASGSAQAPASSPIGIPLNDGREYVAPEAMIAEWTRLYPSVDVLQQLRSMRGWCLSHTARRKTRGGVERFANNWLSNEQDKSPRRVEGERGTQPKTFDAIRRDANKESHRKVLERLGISDTRGSRQPVGRTIDVSPGVERLGPATRDDDKQAAEPKKDAADSGTQRDGD